MSEVEETLKRIQSHRGVIGVIIVNNEGIPIRTTMDNSTTVQYAGLIHELAIKARSTVRDIDPTNDLTFLRIRSKKHEIMIDFVLTNSADPDEMQHYVADKEYYYVDHSPGLPRHLELASQYNRRKRPAQQIKDFYSMYKKKC